MASFCHFHLQNLSMFISIVPFLVHKGFLLLYFPLMQAVPLSARKSIGGSAEGIAPFLQLPHFSEAVIKKIARKVSK